VTCICGFESASGLFGICIDGLASGGIVLIRIEGMRFGSERFDAWPLMYKHNIRFLRMFWFVCKCIVSVKDMTSQKKSDKSLLPQRPIIWTEMDFFRVTFNCVLLSIRLQG